MRTGICAAVAELQDVPKRSDVSLMIVGKQQRDWTADKLHRVDGISFFVLNLQLCCARLMRPGGREHLWQIVPDEAKPLNRETEEFWPPDWDDKSGRCIATERAAFQLLEVPYREPWERDCP